MRMKAWEPNLQLPQQSNNGTALKVKLLSLQKRLYQLGILDLTKKLNSIKLTLKVVGQKSLQVINQLKNALSLKRLKTRDTAKKAMVSPLKMALSQQKQLPIQVHFTQLVLFFKWEKMTYRTVKSVTSQASATVDLCQTLVVSLSLMTRLQISCSTWPTTR